MSLATRCPSCATTFRVLPPQLSVKGGRVRCGRCSAVFDGVANLLTEEAVAALPDEPSPQLGLFEVGEHFPSPSTNAKPGSASAPGLEEPAAAGDAEHGPQTREPLRVPMERMPETIIRQTAGLTSKKGAGDVPLPAFMESAPPQAKYVVVWSLLSLIALAGIAMQAGLHFRTEIGVLVPQSRAYLEATCDFLGCEIRLPRRPDLLSIESSDLQADGQRQGVIVLNALLRNRAPFAQEFPDLELTLTDQGERAVIRKVLKPRDYLQEGKAASRQGMGGGTEEAVRIFLDTGGLLASGYQLFLFYPCPPVSSSGFWQLSYPSRCQDSGNK